jgi:hypothetical protein
MAASYCTCMAWGIIPPRASMVVLAPWACAVRLGPTHQLGPDLSCEEETSRGDPSSGELVGDATIWP